MAARGCETNMTAFAATRMPKVAAIAGSWGVVPEAAAAVPAAFGAALDVDADADAGVDAALLPLLLVSPLA
jgi:hypothetical protein